MMILVTSPTGNVAGVCDHSPPSSSAVPNEWRYTFTHSYAFMAHTGITWPFLGSLSNLYALLLLVICKYTLIHVYESWAKCGVLALRKLTYVDSALLLPGHVGMPWKLLRTQCTFGNQGLSAHSEEVRFLEFLVSCKNWVNLMMCMHKTKHF